VGETKYKVSKGKILLLSRANPRKEGRERHSTVLNWQQPEGGATFAKKNPHIIRERSDEH